jgi:type VI secretion system protein ImpG
MPEDLLGYYNRELDALHGLAGAFANAHPKVAGRLRMRAGAVDDPHVGRLLEGVAFLAARAQQRLDDEFPEISDALLSVLYPHYLAPVPSAAIVRFTPRPDARVPYKVPRGTPVETDPVRGEPCRFRTTADATLWPVAIEATRLTGLPLAAPAHPATKGARSSLRIVLRTLDPEQSMAELGLDRIRVYLDAPPAQSLALYELMSAHLVGAAAADGPNDDRPTMLPPDMLRPAGFAPEEALYPWSARSFSGFRLLTEYFALPEKFLFFDLEGLDARSLVQDGNRLELFLYFDVSLPDLERGLQPDCLTLGCAPMVNLFPRACEPVRLDYRRTEYPLVPDNRRPDALEIWSVEDVTELRDDGGVRPWRPFYRRAAPLAQEEAAPAGFYALARRASVDMPGTDLFIAPFDPDFSADAPADGVLSIDALCSNRDLPGELPFGDGAPRLRLPEGAGALSGVMCLTPPHRSLRAPAREHRSWRLITHLALGHVSLVGGEDAARTLREVLKLYDLRDTAETRAAIAALTEVDSTPATARVPGARPGSFCRGLDVRLTFDAQAWRGGGLYLLAAVLSRFLALHAGVNSFVRLTAGLAGRPGGVAQFPPMAGARQLL